MVSRVHVPASPVVSTCAGYERLDGDGDTPLAGPAGITDSVSWLKC